MLIFAKGWSVDKDGPGQRLVFYLKGCNLRCSWCASPESISPETQIMFYPGRSKKTVDKVCHKNAVNADQINRDICASCIERECVSVWKNPCFEIAGSSISPEELALAARDSRDFFSSGGGVTFGGGEPTLQANEILETVDLLRKDNIDIAMETNAATTDFWKVASQVDHLICDLKCVDSARHKKMTGMDNELILKNLRKAASKHPDFLLRVPLVSGLNTDDAEISRIASFVGELRGIRPKGLKVEILRMHHLGEPKYAALGWKYPMKNTEEPNAETLERLSDKLAKAGATIITT